MSNIRDALERTLREDPDAKIIFTDAIAPDSHHQSRKKEQSTLWLHPSHRSIVDALRTPHRDESESGSPVRHLRAI